MTSWKKVLIIILAPAILLAALIIFFCEGIERRYWKP